MNIYLKGKTRVNQVSVYDLETLKTDRAVAYIKIAYELSKFSGINNRVITSSQYQNCLEGCIVFKGVNCINTSLDHALRFNGEVEQVDKKNYEYTFCKIAHNESRFDTHFVLNKLPE